jgi:RimJ/RimL family protein N-acetyltransferase
VSELAYPEPLPADDLVRFRKWRKRDRPALYAAFSDPEILRFSWSHAEPFTEADAGAFIEWVEQGRRHGDQVQLAMVAPQDDEEILGCISLYRVELDERRAAIGYWVAAGARRRGVATRAVQLMAAWAFDELRLARLELTTAPDNEGSQRVARRCGFVEEGRLRSHLEFKGGRRDTVVFGALPADLVRAPQ